MRKFRGKNQKSKTTNMIVFWMLVLALGNAYIRYEETSTSPLSSDSVTFSKCTDGDTAHFMINGDESTIRLLAIDTPETVKPNTPVQPYGKEASDFTCNALKNANEIKLEYEPSNETDKYGRKLAWVFVDDQLLQLQLIENGLAEVAYLYGDYRYTNDLQEAQQQAKNKQYGIWSQEK